MKKVIIFCYFLLSVSGLIAQNRDSVQVGLPGNAGGIKNFTLVLTRWTNSPAVFESITILAAPTESLSKIRSFVNSSQAKDFSATRKSAIALLYTNADTNFASLSNPVILADSLKKALQRLGTVVNRPEFANAPLLPCGNAAASRFALACGSALPTRTAGMASLRAYRLNPFTSSVAEIPHLVLTGEVSGPDVRDNAAVYFSSQLQAPVLSRRASGELIRHAVEMNASQSTFSEKTAAYLLDYLNRCIQKRIPANSNPVAGPVVLNQIQANSGWLGKANTWDSFVASNYTISPFSGGTLTPATSQWFFDQSDAQAWKDFHQTIFDSVVVSPLPSPVVPYCSGLRPSALNAQIYVKQGVSLNPDNYFRLEVSDITGNFDNPVYKARWFGTTLTSATFDSIVDGTIPDNFSYMTNTSNPNIRRYRIRLTSSSPYSESANFGETDIPFCGAAGLTKPRVYLSTLKPYKRFYNPGDSVEVMVYKNPESPYTPGNNLRLELSNSAGQFVVGSTTNLFSGIPPFTAAATTDSFLVKMKIPDTLSYGPRYRIKAYIDGLPGNQSRQTSNNGHDITIVPNQNGTEIQLTTQTVSGIQQTSAVSGGNILFDGGSAILERGVCWSTSPQPTTSSPKTSDGTGSGSFTSNISGLLAGTLYHVRAYARNANETRYGEEFTFTTLLADQVPVLSTTPVTAITQTTAISGGDITFDGNSSVTSRGVCWSTGSLPTIDLTTKTDDGIGAGSFISNITGLDPGVQYCVRAYAVNSTGAGYGNEICFTTASAVAVIPSVNTLNVTQLSTCDSARSGGNISFDGGAAVTERGVVWSTQPDPTVALPTKTVNGSGSGSFTSVFGNLSSATTYFIRAYATNSVGTGYGIETSFTTCVSNRSIFGETAVLLVPNPASESARIVSGDIETLEVRITNLQGVEFASEWHKDGNDVKLDLRNLPTGYYQISVQTRKGPAILPLIKF